MRSAWGWKVNHPNHVLPAAQAHRTVTGIFLVKIRAINHVVPMPVYRTVCSGIRKAMRRVLNFSSDTTFDQLKKELVNNERMTAGKVEERESIDISDDGKYLFIF